MSSGMKRFALAATALLGACNLYFGDKPPPRSHGTPDPEPPPEVDAGAAPTNDYQEFVTNVYPVLETSCIGCHVGGNEAIFGTTIDPLDVYTAIIDNSTLTGCGNASAAELITKGAHEGPVLTADQAQTIWQWLSDALADGALSCGYSPPGDPQIIAEEQFAACESVSGQDITTSGADQLAQVPTEDGRCSSCHAPDLSSASSTLAYWETEVGLENYFTAQIDANGAYQVVFDTAAVAAKGTELANGTGTHPAFTLSKTVTDAMAQFVADVDSLEDAGECPPAAFGPF